MNGEARFRVPRHHTTSTLSGGCVGIKHVLASPRAQTRANGLQAVGHYARLHGSIDHELLNRLRHALSDRTPLHRTQICGYASHAASDVGKFVRRRELPRWLLRRFAGPVVRRTGSAVGAPNYCARGAGRVHQRRQTGSVEPQTVLTSAILRPAVTACGHAFSAGIAVLSPGRQCQQPTVEHPPPALPSNGFPYRSGERPRAGAPRARDTPGDAAAGTHPAVPVYEPSRRRSRRSIRRGVADCPVRAR